MKSLWDKMRETWGAKRSGRPTKILVAGWFDCKLLDPNGIEVDRWRTENAAVTVGLNYLLGAGFNSVAPITAWKILLINASGFGTVAPTDTMASHAGWVEFVNYNETTRPAWTPGAASGGQISSSSATVFTISTGGGVIQGMGLTSDNTKSGTTGTLWATALETSGPRTVTAGQSLQVFYTNTLTPVS